MTTHTKEARTPSVIHAERVRAAQFRAERALDATRGAAWDAGNRRDTDSTREDSHAREVTAAVAELVALALGVES
jgi:hypothetical protein